jgi:hypothetical protein
LAQNIRVQAKMAVYCGFSSCWLQEGVSAIVLRIGPREDFLAQGSVLEVGSQRRAFTFFFSSQ